MDQNCQDRGVRYTGNALTEKPAGGAEECASRCNAGCGGWTLQDGRCRLVRQGQLGDRVPATGAVRQLTTCNPVLENKFWH